MKIKKAISILFFLMITITIITSSVPLNLSAASSAPLLVDGDVYYIKNKNSGQYLDIKGGDISEGTSIIQYRLHGGNNQRWRIRETSPGVYKIASYANTNCVLTVSATSDKNNLSLKLSKDNGEPRRRFNIVRNNDGYSYRIVTGASGYSKAVVVENASVTQGTYVIQYTYNGTQNDEWIFEPVFNYSSDLGVQYASKNYDSHVETYPIFNSGWGSDCANFTSQCMLAGGIHFQKQWWIYKKNNDYLSPKSSSEFDHTWDVGTMGGFLGFGESSPWISAKQFNTFWTDIVSRTDTYTIKDAKSKKAELYQLPYEVGDVIMILKSNGEGHHCMYITDIRNGDYYLTYHSNNKWDQSLQSVISTYPDDNWKVKFFKMK